MSVWTTPITWANAAVTAAQMNAEIRDHMTYLKGALDNITAGTTADTGGSTYLNVDRPSGASTSFSTLITGDTYSRLEITADGKHGWGTGTAAASTFLTYAGGSLTAGMPTDGALFVQGSLLLRADALGTGAAGRFIGFAERIDTPAPAADEAYLYCRDNGAGKTQIVARFPTGAIQTIATEP